ncbi:holin [Konateibacter massiliensis]|uniref:holin n=1 Tax=Konateibacter massiliensis TaxID=2002841 RepID=UPI000C14F08A|nr:holin [Konateibacter massiliensis]
MSEKTKTWLKAAGVRAIKTVAQTAVAAIGTTAAMGDVSWVTVASTAVLAGILSLLTSVAGLPEIKETANSTEHE